MDLGPVSCQRRMTSLEPNTVRRFAYSRCLIKVERVLACAGSKSMERPETHVSGGGAGPKEREPQNRRLRLLWTRDLGIGMGQTDNQKRI